jgi:hypothetical protein
VTASLSDREPRTAVLKLITPIFMSQPYLIDKKGEAVKISIKKPLRFSVY